MKKTTSVADRFAAAAKRGYDTGKPSKGTTPPPKPTVKARPTGGLKPSGAKATIQWKF